ncbi:hypothetical protein GJ633_02245 [Halorubrum sp. CBA1125]|nr:hypothetical protein [Halorubrum sp. CBA1125]
MGLRVGLQQMSYDGLGNLVVVNTTALPDSVR